VPVSGWLPPKRDSLAAYTDARRTARTRRHGQASPIVRDQAASRAGWASLAAACLPGKGIIRGGLCRDSYSLSSVDARVPLDFDRQPGRIGSVPHPPAPPASPFVVFFLRHVLYIFLAIFFSLSLDSLPPHGHCHQSTTTSPPSSPSPSPSPSPSHPTRVPSRPAAAGRRARSPARVAVTLLPRAAAGTSPARGFQVKAAGGVRGERTAREEGG